MPRPIPIYKDHDETYRADSCALLIAATEAGSVRVEALRHGHYPGRALPAGALAGVKMAGFWDAASDQSWGLDWHRNEGLEITMLEGGGLEFGMEGRSYHLKPDSLTITRPWQMHRVGAPHVTASRLTWIILDLGVRRPSEEWKWPAWLLLSKPDLDELTNMLRHNEQPVWTATADLRRCFHAISQAVAGDVDGSRVSHLAIRISELFLCLLELFRSKDVKLDASLSSTRRTVELFLRDLRRHPENLALKWSLESMADSCGLGVTQFVHHVRCLSNTSPMQYLNQSRLEVAAAMLRERRAASVLEISLACGFSSSQYFATAFDRRYGAAPSAYRSQAGQASRPTRDHE